jgi:hypothetical protein
MPEHAVVFISHTTRDNRDFGLAHDIANGLRAGGAKVWIAPENIPAGDQWREDLVRAVMNKCTHFLVILSEAAVRAEWVIHEIDLARKRYQRDAEFRILSLPVGRLLTYRHQRFLGRFQSIAYHRDFHAQLEEVTKALALRPTVPDSVRALVEEKTQGFVGRAYIFDAIQGFFSENPKGYFVLEGDPGAGKSAIMAELVRRTGAIAHFNIRAQGINTPRHFLENVCAQLITRFGLSYASLPAEAARDGGFLSLLLHECAEQLRPGERLIVAVDALDEVEQPESPANILYLPAALPESVYFVLSQRRAVFRLIVAPPQGGVDLRQYHDDALGDVRTYIAQEAQARPKLARWIGAQGMPREETVRRLAARSAGNFMYLQYVLPELEAGARLDRLPVGLDGYYQDHWSRMGMTAKPLPRMKIRIIYVLSVARAPISRRLIARLADDADEVEAQEVLDEWAPFLRQEAADGAKTYAIYHASFQEFLHRRDIVNAAGVTLKGIHALNADGLWEDLFGARVAGSLADRLQTLDREQRRYTLETLAERLHQAGHFDRLRTLFASDDWLRARYEGGGGTWDGYLADLAAACETAEGLDDLIRYTLIQTSLNSVSGNYPPELIAAALSAGVWKPWRALSAAAILPDRVQQAKVYASILKTGKLDVWEGAAAAKAGLETALKARREAERDFSGEAAMVDALVAMAPHLPGPLLDQALEAVRKMKYPKYKADCLIALAPHCEEPARTTVLREALEAARQIDAPFFRSKALTALVDQLPSTSAEAIQAVDCLKYDFLELAPLIELAGRLTEPQRGRLAQQACQMIQKVGPDTAARQMGNLLAILQSPLRETAAHEFLTQAISMPVADREGELPRPTALIGIAPYLSADDLERAVACGRSLPLSGESASMRASVLGALSQSARGAAKTALILEALDHIRAGQYLPSRAASLIEMIPYLEGNDREGVIQEALTTALTLWDRGVNYGDPSPRLVMLGMLAPHLKSGQVAEALSGALTIKDAEQQAFALVSLAGGLEGAARTAILSAALDAIWSLCEDPMAIFPIEAILKHMEDELIVRAFEMVMTVQRTNSSVNDWAKAIRALAPRLPASLAAKALATVEELDNPRDRAEVLAALVPRLEGGTRSQAVLAAIAAVREIRYGPHLRAYALRDLAPSLDRVGIAETWELLDTLEEDRYRDEVFVPLAPRLRGKYLQPALQRARRLKEPYDRVRALVGLAPRLNARDRGSALREAYRIAAAMKVDELDADHAALALAPHLEGKQRCAILKKGLARAMAIGNLKMSASVLADMVAMLEGEERTAALREGFTRAIRIEESKTKGEVLARLIGLMDAALREECLALAHAIGDRRGRLEVMAALLPWLPDDGAAVAEARGLLCEYLQEMGTQKRQDLLEFMDQPSVFAPPLLTPEVAGAVAASIVEICGRWRWA